MSERILTAVVCVGVGIGVGVGLKVLFDSRTGREACESHNHDHFANDCTSPTGNGSRGIKNDSVTGDSPSEAENTNNSRARYDTEVIYDREGSMSIEDVGSENVNGNSNSSNTVSQSADSDQGHTPQNNSSNTGIQSSNQSQRHVQRNNNPNTRSQSSNSRHTSQNNDPNSSEIESLQTDGGPTLSDLTIDGSFGRENSVPETDSTPFRSNFDYDAVILHADEDEQMARQCHRMLSEDGAAIAFIDDLIKPGSYVTAGMANLLESCRLIIIFHTRNFNGDGLLEYGKHANLIQCVEHIDPAKRNRVIPCLADDTELSQDLRTFQPIDFNDDIFSQRMSTLFQQWRNELR